MFWDVFTMQGANAVGMVYANNEADALAKARLRWAAVVFVKVYRG